MNQTPLYCPISKTALTPASETQLKAFDILVQGGQIFNRNGDLVEGGYSQILLNKNLDIAYQIHLDIPQLLPALSMSLDGVNLVNSVD